MSFWLDPPPFFAGHALSHRRSSEADSSFKPKRFSPRVLLKIWTSWNWKAASIMIMWLYVDYVNWKSQYQHNEFFLICRSFTCVYIIEKDFKTCRHSHKHTVFPLLVETCSSSMPPLCTITLYGFHTGVMQSWSCSKNAFNTTKSQIIC